MTSGAGADQVANGNKNVTASDAEFMVHLYKMSEEQDEPLSGDLSGKSSTWRLL